MFKYPPYIWIQNTLYVCVKMANTICFEISYLAQWLIGDKHAVSTECLFSRLEHNVLGESQCVPF